MRWFRALPLLWQITSVLLVLVGLWGGFELWKKSIYDDGYREASAACKARAREQEREIQKVLDEGERDQAQLEEAIRMLEKRNAGSLDEIDVATAADPAGRDICISPSGVLRLDVIR